ncbi:MAG: hypothetical protein M1470_12155 [Bacteroidetes bacterium]|nr:hypothetical protein [Bacteroidota bacterium]MCL5737166.1 hypothetical protein [Bacteroidota bacterium]
MVIIITKEFDPHSDIVASKLKSKVFRLDIEDLISGKSTIEIIEGKTIFINKFVSISLDEIDTVYWRKPLINVEQVYPENNKVTTSWRFLLDNLAGILSNKRWINHPNHYWLASKKLFQLLLAKELGLNVPKYSFSTIPQNAFLNLGVDKALFKSITTQLSVQGVALEKSFGNVLLEKDDVDGEDILPSLFQEFLKRKAEWRISIVDKKVFPAKLLVEGDYIDIKEKENYSVISENTPSEISNKLLKFMEVTHLNYCAFDLIEDYDNKFFFLEANPNGQWLWIEQKTNLMISNAIANLIDGVTA